MQVVCEATQSSDTKVRVAALQCLVKIMSLYYQYMEYYMGPALFAVSVSYSKIRYSTRGGKDLFPNESRHQSYVFLKFKVKN